MAIEQQQLGNDCKEINSRCMCVLRNQTVHNEYLIGPFVVSKLGNEIINLLVKGSNIVITDGVLEGIGGASAIDNRF